VSENFWSCYNRGTDCEQYNGCDNYHCFVNEVPFLDWVDCYRDSYDKQECGDLSGSYYKCYMYE
jgi:hypothetical protein